MKFANEDIVITDPCYFIPYDKWDESNFGTNLSIFGVSNYISTRTLYGDWSCTVYNLDKDNDVIGEFCADAGLVAVISLQDIIEKINSDFLEWAEEHSWCVTIIRNFTGEVDTEIVDDELHIFGRGNINFITVQTGL